MLRPAGLSLLALLVLASLYVGAKEGAFDFTPLKSTVTTPQEKKGAADSIDVTLEDRVVTLLPAATRLKSLDGEERAFVKSYVEALRKQDAAALKRLIHPASLQCLGEMEPAYLPARLGEELQWRVPAHYYLFFEPLVQHYSGEMKAAMERAFVDPIPSSHTLVLFHRDAVDGEHAVVQQLAQLQEGEDAGQFRLVLGCPTEETIGRFRARRAEKQQDDGNIQAAYAKLNEPLKSALLDRIKKRQLNEAVQQCESQCGVEPSVAYGVVLRLKQELEQGKK